MVAPKRAAWDGPAATATDPGTFIAQADVLTPAGEVRTRQGTLCLYGSIFCLAVGLERSRGFDALETGFALLPMTAATAAMALLAGRLVPRFGEWRVLLAGVASGAAGATLVALDGRPANVGLLLVFTVPIGFTELAMPAMTGLAMTNAAKLGLGLSAGVFNTSRQAGGALGVAVLGTALTAGSAVSLRPAFALTACAYGLAVALAAVGGRRTHVSVGLGPPHNH